MIKKRAMVLQARAYANAVPDQQSLYPSGQRVQVCDAHGGTVNECEFAQNSLSIRATNSRLTSLSPLTSLPLAMSIRTARLKSSVPEGGGTTGVTGVGKGVLGPLSTAEVFGANGCLQRTSRIFCPGELLSALSEPSSVTS